MDTIGLVHDVNNLLAHPYALKVTGKGEGCKIEKRSIFGIIWAWLTTFGKDKEAQALEYLKQKDVTDITDLGSLPSDPAEWRPLLRETIKTQHLYQRITQSETDLSKKLETIAYKSLYASLLNKVLDEEVLKGIYNTQDTYQIFNSDFNTQSIALVRKITVGNETIAIAGEYPTEQEVEAVTGAINALSSPHAIVALQQQNITGVTQDTQGEFYQKASTLPSFTLDSENASLNIQKNDDTLTLTYTLPLQDISINNTPIENTAGTVTRILTIDPDGTLSATQTFTYK